MIKKFRFLFVFASLGSILLISSAKQQNVALADIDAAAQAGYWNCWDDGTIDPCHRDFFDVSMISDSDGWAVGEDGLIARWSGTNWTKISISFEDDLHGVDMLSSSDGWVVGSSGIILHWDGNQWSSVASPTSVNLYAIKMLTVNDGWIVGSSGTILRWNGIAWSDVPTSATTTLSGIDMVSSTDGWAVGGDTILRWNGSAWTEVANPDTNIWLNDVDMVSSTDGWAVGSDYALFRWNGSNWSVWDYAYPSNGFINDVEMVNANDGWAVGDFGSIMHWNGSAWEYTTGLDSSRPSLNATSMVSGSSGWMVGSTSAVLNYSSSAWNDTNLPFSDPKTAMDFVSSTDGWAVGAYGNILRWNGSSWTEISSPVSTQLKAISMVSSTNGWIVGENGVILRWNGSNWSQAPSPTSSDLNSVSMLSVTDGWIVGVGDSFYRWNGASWNPYPSPNNLPFHAVDMVSPTDGWAVGGVFIGPPNWLSGYIYRWYGGDWTRVDSTIQYQYLNTVAMLDSNTGWVAGDQWNTAGQYFENTILQWSGSAFSEVYNIDTVPSGLFNDIDAITASDVWAVGDHSNISHWDGTDWRQVISPTANHFSAIAMVATDEGWIAGNDGIFLSYSHTATLDINYSTGAPGSFFTLTGDNFPASSTVNIYVNDLLLGSIQSDTNGSFIFLLSTSQANEGIYFATASVNPSARVRFDLDSTEPVRSQEGSGTIFDIPPDIEYTDLLFLPMIVN